MICCFMFYEKKNAHNNNLSKQKNELKNLDKNPTFLVPESDLSLGNSAQTRVLLPEPITTSASQHRKNIIRHIVFSI